MKLWETKILALKKKLTTNNTKNPTIWEMCKILWETELLKLKQSVMQYESVWQKVLSKVLFMNTLHQTVSIEIQKPSLSPGLGLPEMSVWPHCHEVTLHVTSLVSRHNDTLASCRDICNVSPGSKFDSRGAVLSDKWHNYLEFVSLVSHQDGCSSSKSRILLRSQSEAETSSTDQSKLRIYGNCWPL